MCLYSAETGELIKVAKVNDGGALWTVTIGKDGKIYYIDTDKETGNRHIIPSYCSFHFCNI